MNPAVKLILTKNLPDIEAIIGKVGVPTLLSIMPQILNIIETLQTPPPK